MEALETVRKGLGFVRRMMDAKKAEILLGMGLAGFGTTIFFVHKASPKGHSIVSYIKDVWHDRDILGEETVKDELKHSIKDLIILYTPSAIFCGVSVGCILAGHSVQSRKIAILSSAYAISEEALRKTQTALIEELGEEAKEKIADRIARNEAPFDEDYSYKIEKDGSVLCYDRVTGRYFKSSMEEIRSAESWVIKDCVDNGNSTLNDFYTQLGLSDNSFIGEGLGWTNVPGQLPDIYFTSMVNKDGEPCLVLNYNVKVIDKRVFGDSNLAYY